jgi:hypothetical protein
VAICLNFSPNTVAALCRTLTGFPFHPATALAARGTYRFEFVVAMHPVSVNYPLNTSPHATRSAKTTASEKGEGLAIISIGQVDWR